MGVSNFPVDLVLLGMIAAFLVLRLRSVLGKRTGFERDGAVPRVGPRPGPGKVIDVRAESPQDAARGRVVPERDSPLGQTLARVQALDSHFSPARFLDGAEGAFRLIVLAFGKGDVVALKPLLSAGMLSVFEQAITEREAAGQVQHTTVHSIRSTEFNAATLTGTQAEIAVHFVSDQVSYTTEANGQIAVGTEAVTEIADLWTFERDLASRDPAWRLAAAQSA